MEIELIKLGIILIKEGGIWISKHKNNIKDWFANRKIQSLKIAFIEPNFSHIFVMSWAEIKISYKDFKEKILPFYTTQCDLTSLLQDCGLQNKYCYTDSGELAGSELDTPDFEEFDIIMK